MTPPASGPPLASGPLPPGSTIGVLGGGQLGRMMALAAARLGYRVHVFTPEADSPCAQVCAVATVADYDDVTAIDRFAQDVDVVTLEFENVPATTVSRLEATRHVYPGGHALAITQDRIAEKRFVSGQGLKTAAWKPAASAMDVGEAVKALGGRAIAKTTRLGYDGKGQLALTEKSDPAEAWRQLGEVELIVEQTVPFVAELSVVLARGIDGTTADYPVVLNHHVHHILAETIAPAPVSTAVAAAAAEVARRVADGLDYVGVLAVELFLLKDNTLLVNEIAPRPHNSGHWTIDCCATSQFEQQARAVAGLPLGDTTLLAGGRMTNLIGDAVDAWSELVAEKGARVHLYGKAQTRAGRKMGHVTRLVPLPPAPPQG